MFEVDHLDEDQPFEIDSQAAHLFKHAPFGIDDLYDVWRSDPLFYPAKAPAHWLMIAKVGQYILVVPLAPPDSGELSKCRPIGCFRAGALLATQYLEDR